MIKIQLLEYVYGSGQNNQINISNATLNTSGTYPWMPNNAFSATIDNQTTGVKYLSPVSGKMTKGVEYTISATVSNFTGTTGNIGFSASDSSGAANGVGSTARRTGNGTISHTFTALGNQDVRIFSESNGGGTLEKMSLTQTSSVDWTKSVVGVLDVGSSQDFPLALTFGIADARELDGRTGTYSKSFNIPATKNNNKVLKAVYMEGSDSSENKMHKRKSCRIMVDDFYSIEGFFQLTAVHKGSSPAYYSCVFYGDNVSWASSLETKRLRNLAVKGGADGSGWDSLNGKTGTNLTLDYDSIVASWDVNNATDSTPYGGATTTNTLPVVYPNCSYGEKNEGGECNTQQLLKTASQANGWSASKTGYWGWDSNNNAYGTPEPVLDWRPGIFIYDIIKQIFSQEGFSVSSSFMETDMFKSLIMLLPNFKYIESSEREKSNSAGGRYYGSGAAIRNITETTSSISAGGSHWDNWNMRFNMEGNYIENSDYDNTIYDDSTGYFTVAEAGYYDISIEDCGLSFSSFCLGTATDIKVNYARLQIDVQTVGETGWNKLVNVDSGFVNTEYNPCSNYFNHPTSEDVPPNLSVWPPLSVERRYLNQGDKVKFTFKLKMTNNHNSSKTIGYDMTLWGGNPYQTSVSSVWQYKATGSGVVNFKFYGEDAAYGQTYDLKDVIDAESTQMGFLKGVIHAFNLYMTTDVAAKTVYIEPFNDFFEVPNLAVDWTGKVDLSQNQEDKWIENDLSRTIVFKYKTDPNDKYVEWGGKTLWDGVLDVYPYREFLGDDYPTGVSLFENPFFAGTSTVPDGENAGNNICRQYCTVVPATGILWGLCDDDTVPQGCGECRPDKGNDFLPRLLTYVRDVNAPDADYMRWYTEVQLWTNQTDFITTGEPLQWTGGTINYPIMARAVAVDPKPDSDNRTPVLSYGTVRRSGWKSSNPNAAVAMSYNKGLYQTYYQKMIEMLKKENRIKIVFLNLKISDILELNLRKLVYIDGYYYRINRVIDFQPNNNNPTKVELLLWEEVGDKAADAAPGFNNPWTS